MTNSTPHPTTEPAETASKSSQDFRPRPSRPIDTGIRTKIAGTGSYLPEKLLTNADLEKLVETNDQWIRERTGIEQRHLAAE